MLQIYESAENCWQTRINFVYKYIKCPGISEIYIHKAMCVSVRTWYSDSRLIFHIGCELGDFLTFFIDFFYVEKLFYNWRVSMVMVGWRRVEVGGGGYSNGNRVFMSHGLIYKLLWTGWVCVYVTTFCYLSLCEPMSAWISPYLTVLVFVSTNQRASSRKA